MSDSFKSYTANPGLKIHGKGVEYVDAEIHDLGLGFRYRAINKDNTHTLIIVKGNRPEMPFIAMKATIFPFINLLWIGAIIWIEY